MKIVLLNQFFWPDTVATSQILTAVARSLGEKHEATVICGGGGTVSKTPEGNFGPNLSVARVWNVRFGHSLPARIASYLGYLGGVLWRTCSLRDTDCFLTLTTPPVLPVLVGVIARARRAKHVIWEMDIYPDIATDVGLFKKGGVAEYLIGAVLDWSRRRADTIIALGEDMKDRLLARGIPDHKIYVAENWADGREITPMNFPDGPLTVHYSGNLGLAHEVETIAAVITSLANNPDFRFIFTGGGPRRPQLESYCRKRSIMNVEFRPFCSNAQLSESLAEGHLGLVTQIPETLGSIVPSKIYGIMASGRPLLYIGPGESTPARHIRNFQCGWHFQPGDCDGVVRLLHQLCVNRHVLNETGKKARLAFDRNFDRPVGVARILLIVFESNIKQSPHDLET